tara:strand:+ start:274 stop:1608 length:1335 start_codon:yes stop_codon:yes gene_type:complete
MTISLGNRAKMSTSTTGTGTITLGSAVSGFQTFADAGITNGQTVRYAIDDGANFEIGSGTYTSSGTTLTRAVTESSNSDSAISLSGGAEVFIAATVADLNPLYAANPSSATNPTATGSNSVAIGSDAQATSTNGSIAFGQSTRATGNSNAAIGFQANASGAGALAIGYTANAAASFSAAVGYNAKTETGSGSVALGTSYASGAASLAAAINNNTSSYGATGANSVAIGLNAKSTAGNSVAIGSRAVSSNASIAIGTSYANYGVVASGANSIVLGDGSAASQISSVAIGYGANSNIIGKFAYATRSFADGNAEGSSQGGMFILVSDTTDATAEAMTTNKSTAAANNQIVAASDTCITFSGTIVAMQNGAQAYAGWEIKGMLVNDGGTTSLALGNVSDMAATNASSWAVALSADNTNNALKIQVTGEASHNIRWVANVKTAEVTYA